MAVGCGGGAEESMDEGASESPGAARGGVREPGATSGQAMPAAADNTKKRKSRTVLHHKLLEILCPALQRSTRKDARCSHHVLDVKNVTGAVVAVLRELSPCNCHIW